MREYVEDREYIQPEQETIDFLVYAEYINWKLRQDRQDREDVEDGVAR